MKIKSFLIYAGLFVGVFLFTMTGYISGVGKKAQQNADAVVASQNGNLAQKSAFDSNASAPNPAGKITQSYILRENENKISLFIRYSNGDEQIHSEYEVAVNLLPKSDRERLREGIEFDSVDEVIRFIEDYMG